LNLKTRQSERTLLEQQRVTNENTRRKQSGLPPIKALTELAANDQRDAILAETAQIALDLTSWDKQSLARLQSGGAPGSSERAKSKASAQ
jgi:hypothetical protein